MENEVRQALENVRPALQADGGDVELVEVTEDGVVPQDDVEIFGKVRAKGEVAYR